MTEEEVYEVFDDPDEELPSRDGTRAVLGRTSGGRWLKVIYAGRDEPDEYFVLTAYPPTAKAIKALRRRFQKKP